MVFAGVIVVCIPLSLLFDRFKLLLRSSLSALTSRKAVDHRSLTPSGVPSAR